MKYRGVDIVRTNSVCLSQGNKHLYQLTGAVNLDAETRPFLTTIAAAKRFVDEQLLLNEIAEIS